MDDLPARLARLTVENAALWATVTRQAAELADAERTVARLAAEITEIGTWVRTASSEVELRTLFYQRWGIGRSVPRPTPLWLETPPTATPTGAAALTTQQ